MTSASQAQPAVAPRQQNPRGQGQRLREDIITAASQMIAENGDHGALTLRGVAKRVGIAAPSIYRHFADAEQLKMAVVGRAFAQFAQARDAASHDHDDPAAALLARCRAYCNFAMANPGPYRFMFSQHAPAADPPGSGPGMPAFRVLAESIRRCQQAGLAQANDDPHHLAAQVWAALHGLVLLRMNLPTFPWPARLEQMADQAVTRLIALEAPPVRHPA